MSEKQAATSELPDEFLTVVQSAKRLTICRSKMYALVYSGAVRHLRIGKSIRIRESAILEYEQRNTAGG
jgi:excisionase family DNA binding protein